MKLELRLTQRSLLISTLAEQCDPRHPLRKLGERIPWSQFEEAFSDYDSEEGRPALPAHPIVGLLWLKQIYDQSDASVVYLAWEQPWLRVRDRITRH